MNLHNWRRISKALTEAEVPECGPSLARSSLEALHGQVWCSLTLARDYEVEAFCKLKVVVVRRSDGQRGTMSFQHNPRFYWGFVPD